MNKSGFLSLSYQHQSPLGTSVTSYSRKLRHESFHRACTEATLRAVKEVRVVEGDSEAMEVGLVAKLMSSGIKIIHLLRDPRGIIHSRLQLKEFCLKKGVILCADDVCGTYRNTLRAVDTVLDRVFPRSSEATSMSHGERQYLRIKYEDVAMEPVKMLGRIYGWAGYAISTHFLFQINAMIIHLVTSYFSCHRIGQVDPHIAEWAYSTTHAKKSDNAYRIQRNSSAVAYAWREGKKPLTPRQNQIAIRKCGDVLTKLEYETEREITEALQKPLPAPIWTAHSGRRVPSGRYKYNRDGRQKKY
jgi:hypothetical protein